MKPVVLSEIVDRVGIVTLNRPHAHNALNGELTAALDAAVKEMADNDRVKVVVLTGSATPGSLGGFCAGGDVKDFGNSAGFDLGVPPDPLLGDLTRHDRHASMLLHLMPKPSIAMVGGAAIGAGLSLAGACDLRFASEEAVFSAGFMPNGLSGDYGGTAFWTRVVGTAVARQLYLLNERIPAHRALELGMVHAVKPARELLEFTLEHAARMARSPAALLALVKTNLNEAEEEPGRRRFLFASETENQHRAGDEVRRRLAARRRPSAGGAAR